MTIHDKIRANVIRKAWKDAPAVSQKAATKK